MEGKKKKASAVLGIVVCILLGVAMGFFLLWVRDKFLDDVDIGLLSFVLTFAIFFFALLVHVILHELGHLIFGLLTGYRFSSFRIFSLTWVRLEGKIRFKKLSLAGTAGQCLMLPPPLKDGKIPTVWYNLGGAIVNLLISGVCIALALVCKEAPYLALFLVIFAATGLIMGLTNGLPLRVGELDNDGKNALSLRRNEQATFAFWLQLKVNGELANGKRLKDMPPEWFTLPQKEELDNPMLATRGAFAENYLMDCRRFAEVKEVAELLLSPESGILGVHAQLLRCDLAYIALAVDGDKSAATALWTKELVAFQKTMRNFPTVLRTQYAYALLLEGNKEKANELLSRFERVARSYPYAADIEGERELIQIAKAKGEETPPTEIAADWK